MYLNIVTDPTKPDYIKKFNFTEENYFSRFFNKKKRNDLKKIYWNKYYSEMNNDTVEIYIKRKLLNENFFILTNDLIDFKKYSNILEMCCGVAATTLSIKKKFPYQKYFICDEPHSLMSLLRNNKNYNNINLFKKSFYDDYEYLSENNINLVLIENSVYLFELKSFVKFLRFVKKKKITILFSIFDSEKNFYKKKISNLLQVIKCFFIKENYIVEGRRFNSDFYKNVLQSENINFKLKQVDHKIYFCANY